MKLKIVVGKSRSGKTEYCMRNALTEEGGSFIIVPEQYTFTAERKITALQSTLLPGGEAEVISFGRLANRVLETAEGAAAGHMDRAGKVMLLYGILSENQKNLTILKGAVADRSAEMQKLIAEFKRYNVSADELHEISKKMDDPQLKAKLSEISFIYDEFEKALRGRYINSDDNLARLAAEVRKNKKLKEYDIYIDAFSSFTESEFSCIRAFICTCRSVTVTLCADGTQSGRHEFLPTEKTMARLLDIASKEGAKTEKVLLGQRGAVSAALCHLETEFFNYPARIYEEKTDDIEIFTAKNPYDEITHTAAAILRLVRGEGYFFKDIGIIYSNADLYSKYIKSIFHAFGIPIFPDEKKLLTNHPVVVFILSALEVVAEGFSYEPVFRYAKSGFARIPRELADILENYILATGLCGEIWHDSKKWDIRAELFAEKSELSEEEKGTFMAVNRARDIIAKPLKMLSEGLDSGRTIKEKCAALYDFMNFMNLPGRLEAMARLLEKKGDSYRGAEYKNVFGKIIDALDELVDSMGEKEISVNGFFEILSAGLAQYETGAIPSFYDGVISGDIARMRGYDVRALFIIGANDGSFPVIPQPTGFLSDRDRLLMKDAGIFIAPDTKTASLEGEHLLYKAFTCATDKLFISYPSSDFMGAALRPAAAVLRVAEMFPGAGIYDNILEEPVQDITAAPNFACQSLALRMGSRSMTPLYEEIKNRLMEKPFYRDRILAIEKYLNYKNRAKPLSQEKVSALLGSSLYTAVSRLESFSACPFSYFMRYTLRARERRVLALRPVEAGSFMHNFLDEFAKRLKENGKTWRNIDSSYIDTETAHIMNTMEERLNRYLIEKSKRTAYLFTRLCGALKLSVRFISEHIKRGAFDPLGYELTFDENGDFKPMEICLPNGSRIVLTGRIDRADRYVDRETGEKFVRIIDYKSGRKAFDLSEVFYGINLQLAVYLTALCESGGYRPAGILYFRLDDPVIKAEPGADEAAIYDSKFKELKLTGLMVNEPKVLEAADGTNVFSDFLPVRKNKNEEFSGSIAPPSVFERLQEHVKNTVSALSEEIMKGKTDISPYKMGDITACRYCPYKSACRFDTAQGCSYRKLSRLKPGEVFEKIGGGDN